MNEPIKKSILIVDDEPSVLLSLKALLQEKYDLTSSEHADEALSILNRGKKFDLLILDYRLSDMDGLTLFKKIRQDDRVTPILFMSAYGTKELLIKMLEVRAHAFIDKPWDNLDLEKKISRLLGLNPFEMVHRSLKIDMNSLSIKIHRAVQYIDRHFNSPALSLEKVSQAVSLHPKYLSASFKEECGVGFHDYLTEVRINRAINLLKDPHRIIKQVSGEVGFSDQSYFSKVFQNKVGSSPSSYRRQG